MGGKQKNLKQQESLMKNKEKFKTSERANEAISCCIYELMRTENKNKEELG